MTDSWTKTVQKKTIKSDKRITPNYKPRTASVTINDKTNLQPSM